MGTMSEGVQKCMAPYFGKPILERTLEAALKIIGPFRPILCVSYRASDVYEYFGENWHGLPITYALHECGTADRGALSSVRNILSGPSFIAVHGNILFDPALYGEVWNQHLEGSAYATIALATKTNESRHVLMRSNMHASIEDVLVPPPSSDEWLSIANDLSLKISSTSSEDAALNGYCRDMGIHVYNTGKIFKLLDDCDERVVDMSWMMAWQVGKGNAPKAVKYRHDWIHIETQCDLSRTYTQANAMPGAHSVQTI
jgi:NDP-sugar pyrophosphorylase family protein